MRGLVTNKQLLEMSDSDYMNDDQIAYFKYTLEYQKETILLGIAALKKELPATEQGTYDAENATNLELNKIQLKRMNKEAVLINKINKSLRLIDTGDYGYCRDTGVKIGIKRLLVRPTSTLCAEAMAAARA
tara:strand:+ start:1694 stop:2086 length:393 start_codon:yes stop_codon:yes gene_type:complete